MKAIARVDAIVLLPVRPEKISGWTGREFGTSGGTGRVTVRMFGQEGPLWVVERRREKKIVLISRRLAVYSHLRTANTSSRRKWCKRNL